MFAVDRLYIAVKNPSVAKYWEKKTTFGKIDLRAAETRFCRTSTSTPLFIRHGPWAPLNYWLTLELKVSAPLQGKNEIIHMQEFEVIRMRKITGDMPSQQGSMLH